MARSEIQSSDREELSAFIKQHWHSPVVMSRGRSYYPHTEAGFIERRDDQIVGVLTYHIEDDEMEILTLNATLEGKGIGSALMLAAIEKARDLGCHKILLTTTNDRLKPIGFYQRVGFRMTGINLGVVDEARKIKPQIPEFGERGVRIQDEIVMELRIKPYLDEA